MSLNDSLRKVVIEELKNVDFHLFDAYARENQITLTVLHQNRIIDDASIERVLEEKVFRQARIDYEGTIRKERSAHIDNAGRPEYFAYALKKDKFSKEEIEQIPFDHGETAETFAQKYEIKNLLSVLREKFLDPKPLPKCEDYWDPHPVCSE